jgi:hypothetical protein
MTDDEIQKNGYWITVYTLARPNQFGYSIMRQLKSGGWTTELTKSDYKTGCQAKRAAIKELTYIINEHN